MDLQLTLPLVYAQPGQERTQVVPQAQYQTHEVTEQEDKQRTRLLPNMVMVYRRNTGGIADESHRQVVDDAHGCPDHSLDRQEADSWLL